MESPIVVDKPPEYYSKKPQEHDKGFPFDEDEDSAWSDLASRHPDIAARLRARPPAWGRKRRGDAQNPEQHDDVSGSWGDHFNRFPFGDIPTEFREHFPSNWGDRFGSQEHNPQEAEGRSPQRNQQFAESTSRQPPPTQPQPQPKPQQQKSQTIATQTEEFPIGETTENTNTTETDTTPSAGLAQHGLRNTVDLGQKSPADPVLLDGDSSHNQRSMSAPPDNRVPNQNMGNIAGGGPQPSQPQQQEQHSNTEPLGHGNVRHIPIFVEGRDAPVINKKVDQAGSFGETFQPPPPQPEREQFFAERDVPLNFHQPPHFGRNFGTPFSKGFPRQGTQPFAQHGFPQSQFSQQQGAPQQSQARSNSPKPTHTPHTQATPPQAQTSQTPTPAPTPTPPTQPQAPPVNDPITKILNIQKDVLDLMTEVENFTGVKQDKRYIYLDEMLTRNLIKLDDIETEGKENIRMARKEAIKCIQKCINVLEAKAEGNSKSENKEDVEMKEVTETEVNGENQNGVLPDETKEAEPSAEAQPDQPEKSVETPKKKGVKKGIKKREKSKDKVDVSNDKLESSASVDGKEDKPVELTE